VHISFGTPSAFFTVTIYHVWRTLELASSWVGIFGGYIYCENSALKSCWNLVPDSFQSVQSYPPEMDIRTSWNSRAGKICGERRHRAFRRTFSSACICSSGFALLARCFTMKPDDFANRYQPFRDYFPVPGLPEEENSPSSDVSWTHLRCHKQSTHAIR